MVGTPLTTSMDDGARSAEVPTQLPPNEKLPGQTSSWRTFSTRHQDETFFGGAITTGWSSRLMGSHVRTPPRLSSMTCFGSCNSASLST